MDKRTLLPALALTFALILSACGLLGQGLPTYRYRMTVEVETPQGLRSGSSVIEVKTALAGRFHLPDSAGVGHSVMGEAVAVDLPGGRGTLFALLRSDNDVDWPGRIMFLLTPSSKLPGDDGFRKTFDAMLANRSLIELLRAFPPNSIVKDQESRPMLVRFRDMADPRTVERVDREDLAASFGPGVKLRRITVQLTDDPVTMGIEKRLGWLGKINGKYEANQFPSDIPLGNFAGMFSTEFN